MGSIDLQIGLRMQALSIVQVKKVVQVRRRGDQRRLRVPILHNDERCNKCGSHMDKFGDHALACICAGNRSRRHNAIQHCLFNDCKLARLEPTKEKRGLLPERPAEGPRAATCAPWQPPPHGEQTEARDAQTEARARTEAPLVCPG